MQTTNMEAVQMKKQELLQLISLIGQERGAAVGIATVIGQMEPFEFGKDKLKQIKKYNDQIEDIEAKMRALNIATYETKLNFIKSCRGQELT